MTEQLRVQQQRVELLATATAAAAAVAATAAAAAASTNSMDAESTTRDKHGLPLMDKMRVYLIKWKQGRRRVGFLCRTGEYDAVAKVQRAISLRWYKCDKHTGKFQSKDTCGVTQHGFFEGDDGSRAIEANTIITPVESFEASWDQGKYGSHAQKSACALQLIVTRPQLAALRVTQTATVIVTVSRTSALLSRRMPRSMMGKFWSTRSIHATGSAWQTRSGFKAPVMQPISSEFVWLFMRVIPRDLATKFGVSSPAPAFFVLECLGNLQWPQPNQIGASISFM